MRSPPRFPRARPRSKPSSCAAPTSSSWISASTAPLDGIETAKILRRSAAVPVVFVSAYVDDQTRSRAAETHPLAFVAKPLDEIDLSRLLDLLPRKREQ